MRTLKTIVTEYDKLRAELNELSYKRVRQELGMTDEEYRQACEEFHNKLVALHKEGKKLCKNEVEIKDAATVIGCRVTTGYRGKLDLVSCNVLTKVELSITKQEGYVYTPYEIDWDGNAKLTEHEHWYKIRRQEGVVYLVWCPDVK